MLVKKIEHFIIVDLSLGLKIFQVVAGDVIKVNAAKIVALPAGANNTLILDCLRDFIKDNRIPHPKVILIPSLRTLFIKRIVLPDLPESELVQAAVFKLKPDCPFDTAKAVFGYSLINKRIDSDGAKLVDIICALALEDEVRSQVLLLKQAGVEVVRVGISAFGYSSLIEGKFIPGKDTTIGILHFYEHSSYFGIYKQGVLCFYRELPVSVDKLKEALATELYSENKGKVQLTAEEIEKVLFVGGIPLNNQAYTDKLGANQVLALLRPWLELLSQEIKRTCDYYANQFDGIKIEKMLVGGLGLAIPNLDKFLKMELSLDVVLVDVNENIKVSIGLQPETLIKEYDSLGMVLDYNRSSDILPDEFRTQKNELLQMTYLFWVTFIALLLLLFSFAFIKVSTRVYRNRLDNTNFQLNVLLEIKQMKDRLDALNNFFAKTRDSQPQFGMMLKKISNIPAKDLFFSDLSLNAGSMSGDIAGFVKKADLNPDTVLTSFLRDLADSGMFKDINIINVAKSSKAGEDVLTFDIGFKLQ